MEDIKLSTALERELQRREPSYKFHVGSRGASDAARDRTQALLPHRRSTCLSRARGGGVAAGARISTRCPAPAFLRSPGARVRAWPSGRAGRRRRSQAATHVVAQDSPTAGSFHSDTASGPCNQPPPRRPAIARAWSPRVTTVTPIAVQRLWMAHLASGPFPDPCRARELWIPKGPPARATP